MAYKVIQNGNNIQSKVVEVVADTRSDIEDLTLEDSEVGSTCVVLEDGSVWMVGNDKIWHEL